MGVKVEVEVSRNLDLDIRVVGDIEVDMGVKVGVDMGRKKKRVEEREGLRRDKKVREG